MCIDPRYAVRQVLLLKLDNAEVAVMAFVQRGSLHARCVGLVDYYCDTKHAFLVMEKAADCLIDYVAKRHGSRRWFRGDGHARVDRSCARQQHSAPRHQAGTLPLGMGGLALLRQLTYGGTSTHTRHGALMLCTSVEACAGPNSHVRRGRPAHTQDGRLRHGVYLATQRHSKLRPHG